MIYPIRNIVVGVARVFERDPILQPALELASTTGATLHLVHAFEFPHVAWDTYGEMGIGNPSAVHDYASSLRAAIAAQVKAVSTYPRYRIEVFADPPAPLILAAAEREEADLILVGATRHGALARAILGTTAQRVLRGAAVPVLVVRESLPGRLGRVLLTTALTEFDAGVQEIALDVLQALDQDSQPQLRLLHVVWDGGDLPLPIERDLLYREATESLDRFIRERRSRTTKPEPVIRFGGAADNIAAEAREWGPDLLVVGTHSRKGAARLFLGSVAEAALREVGCSVLVIPARLEEQLAVGSLLEHAASSGAHA